VIATQAEGVLEIRGARELRVKESDRIHTVADGLAALGAAVEELEDGLIIRGPQQLSGGRVDSAGDHRIAMAFTIAGLFSRRSTTITGAAAARISFPGFYDCLGSVLAGGTLETDD
jgi:3-phosphoshikimate 1-carboxyvinyltransferase